MESNQEKDIHADIPRWVETAPGEKIEHLYLDPRHESGAFGGYKKVTDREGFLDEMKEKLKSTKDVDERQKIRSQLIGGTGVLRNHSYNHRRSMMKHISQYREEYLRKQKTEGYYDPQNKYVLKRNELGKPKLSQPMVSVLPKPENNTAEETHQTGMNEKGLDLTSITEKIDERALWNNKRPSYNNEEGPLTKSTLVKSQPILTDTHCTVCNVYFCGAIPAQQHYNSKKHQKKMKQNEMLENTGKPTEKEELPIKLDLNLEHCDLCKVTLSPHPVQAASHYSSQQHLNSLQHGESEKLLVRKTNRHYTGSWIDQLTVADTNGWGRPRYNKMGHKIRLKGVAGGPGQHPLPGEEENECRFCDAKFVDGKQAINHYMGKKHQTKLIQTGGRARPRQFESRPESNENTQSICLSFTR